MGTTHAPEGPTMTSATADVLDRPLDPARPIHRGVCDVLPLAAVVAAAGAWWLVALL